MATTDDATQLAGYLAEIRKNCDTAIQYRDDLSKVLNKYGATVADGASLQVVATAAKTLLEGFDGNRKAMIERLRSFGVTVEDTATFEQLTEYLGTVSPNSSVLQISLNPVGSDYVLPETLEEREQLLSGAGVSVIFDGVSYPLSTAISSLEGSDATFSLPIPSSKPVYATIRVFFGETQSSTAYGVAPTRVLMKPGYVTNVTLTTAVISDDVVEIGRVQRFSDASGASFLIRRVTSGGKRTTYFGAFAADGTWVDQSGVKITLQECLDADSEVTTQVINQGGSPDAVDLMEQLNVLKGIKIARVTVNATTPFDNYFVRFPKCYVKTERVTMDFTTLADDGTVATTAPTDCIVKWVCDTQADVDYHLHPLFVRYTRGEDGVITETPLDYGFVPRYPAQAVSATLNGTTVAVARTQPDGSRGVGLSRNTWLGRMRALNQFPITVHVDGEVDVDYAADDDRRWSEVGWLKEISFIQWMAYLFFGVNCQNYLHGIYSTARAATSNGETDFLIAKGILNGASDIDGVVPIVFLGIEDALWSSTGWDTADVSHYNERIIDAETAAEHTESYWLYALDRLDYTPESADTATMLSNGYKRVPFLVNGNDRMGYCHDIALRDAYIPTTDADDGTNRNNIRISGVDEHWNGGAPGAGTAGTNSFKVASGGHRDFGLSLGSFFVNASGALAAVHGDNWRGRASLELGP